MSPIIDGSYALPSPHRRALRQSPRRLLLLLRGPSVAAGAGISGRASSSYMGEKEETGKGHLFLPREDDHRRPIVKCVGIGTSRITIRGKTLGRHYVVRETQPLPLCHGDRPVTCLGGPSLSTQLRQLRQASALGGQAGRQRLLHGASPKPLRLSQPFNPHLAPAPSRGSLPLPPSLAAHGRLASNANHVAHPRQGATPQCRPGAPTPPHPTLARGSSARPLGPPLTVSIAKEGRTL